MSYKYPLQRLLSLFLLGAVLLTFASCQGGKTPTEETTDAPLPSWHLKDFQIVRSENASQTVIDEMKSLNRSIMNLIGITLPVTTDFDDADRRTCEILLGNVEREESQTALTGLSDTQYVIRTVNTVDGCKLVVGGQNATATAEAIRQFRTLLENGNGTGENGELKTFDIIGVVSSASDAPKLEDSLAKKIVLICGNEVDPMVMEAVITLKKELTGYFGSSVALVSAKEDTDLTPYPYAVVFGKAGNRATQLAANISETAYLVKTEQAEGSFRVYLEGGKAYTLLKAAHYFYTQSVRDGKFAIPLNMDVTADASYTRDPCILPYEGVYYLYSQFGLGYGVRTSTDLLHWSSTKAVFNALDYPDFPGDSSFWAPECHYYQGKFYIFGTYHDKNTDVRGVAIFQCDTPDGKFKPWSDGFVTDNKSYSIDGTLYVEKDGTPYMVFVDEWIGNPDKIGKMSYVQLTSNLKATTGNVHIMFFATSPDWTNHKVTDGPYLYRCENGTLLMIWSNNADGFGYAVGVAVCSNGRLDGTWTQKKDVFFTNNNQTFFSTLDGGHGMFFKGFDGRSYLAIHTPNDSNKAPAFLTLLPIVETDGMICLDTIK